MIGNLDSLLKQLKGNVSNNIVKFSLQVATKEKFSTYVRQNLEMKKKRVDDKWP